MSVEDPTVLDILDLALAVARAEVIRLELERATLPPAWANLPVAEFKVRMATWLK